MDFQVDTSISYKSIFDDFDSVKIVDFLSNIPSQNVLEIAAHYLAQIHTYERATERQLEYFKQWLTRIPAENQEKCFEFIKRISINPNARFNFLNNVSLLILIEHTFENFNILPFQESLTKEQEFLLLKAYLYSSQEWIDKQNYSGNKITNANELIELLLPIQLPYAEIIEFKDFRLQFLKAINFFRFCESDNVFKDYLKIFLDERKLNSWQEYILNLLHFLKSAR